MDLACNGRLCAVRSDPYEISLRAFGKIHGSNGRRPTLRFYDDRHVVVGLQFRVHDGYFGSSSHIWRIFSRPCHPTRGMILVLLPTVILFATNILLICRVDFRSRLWRS